MIDKIAMYKEEIYKIAKEKKESRNSFFFPLDGKEEYDTRGQRMARGLKHLGAGAGIGAGAGALLGALGRNPGGGAVAGALLGLAGGGISGTYSQQSRDIEATAKRYGKDPVALRKAVQWGPYFAERYVEKKKGAK